jgi:hypothetical protein
LPCYILYFHEEEEEEEGEGEEERVVVTPVKAAVDKAPRHSEEEELNPNVPGRTTSRTRQR